MNQGNKSEKIDKTLQKIPTSNHQFKPNKRSQSRLLWVNGVKDRKVVIRRYKSLHNKTNLLVLNLRNKVAKALRKKARKRKDLTQWFKIVITCFYRLGIQLSSKNISENYKRYYKESIREYSFYRRFLWQTK